MWVEWQRLYDKLPEPKCEAQVPVGDRTLHRQLKNELEIAGLIVKEISIDLNEFLLYLKDANYERFDYYFNGGKHPSFYEKALEHYISAKLLNLNKNDVYIDIANGDSPSAQIYSEIFGCQSFAQDMYFRKTERNKIAGNSRSIPVKDGFASKMALHNAFEHFEGDDDTAFIAEADRVLCHGGKLCIVPLFMFNKLANQTDPAVLFNYNIFDEAATIFAAKGWLNRFGRHYDVTNLVSRLVNHMGDMTLTIYFLTNEKIIDNGCYAKFVALFEKP